MSKYILDASALLALFNSEPGSNEVEKILPDSIMSAVNVAEVIAELENKLNISLLEGREMIHASINRIIPLDFEQSIEVGGLKRITKSLGLSLGDRACIALGIQLEATVYTADKIWNNLNIEGLNIKLIR